MNSNKKNYTWKDIVLINGIAYAEEFPISGEKDGKENNAPYQIDEFYAAVSQKHQVDTDDIKTYMMDNIDFEPKTMPYGAEACGCYIDGIAEWMID